MVTLRAASPVPQPSIVTSFGILRSGFRGGGGGGGGGGGPGGLDPPFPI